MGWIYLLIAAVFEVGWPLGLKMGSVSSAKVLWIIFSIIVMGLSGVFCIWHKRKSLSELRMRFGRELAHPVPF